MKPGTYQFDARVVIQHRADDPVAELDGLTVGLFVAPPSPEGGSLQEVTAPGYARQAVTFEQAAAWQRMLRSTSTVSFTPVQDWPAATHAGVFRGDGLLASGRLKTSAGHAGHEEAAFAASGIVLKFS